MSYRYHLTPLFKQGATMPRRPRIEIAGYYHIINRGVEQRVIFKEASDYEQFE